MPASNKTTALNFKSNYVPKVGDEVVIGVFIGGFYAPVQHNSKHSPEHPCRGTVVSVGPKWVRVSTTGAPWPVHRTPATETSYIVLPPEEAKPLYRAALAHYGRDPKFIDKCVASL
jgi:hypothetical protein